MRTFVGARGTAAGCVTVTLCPATVMVAVRADAVVFPVAAIETVPLLLPLPPPVMLSQDADSDDVHAQPPVVVTVMTALPPAGTIVGFVGVTTKLHGAASCVTVIVWPATVRVAFRELVAVFAVAV
jgi:hypothetical protein